jgi:hypothetical protein
MGLGVTLWVWRGGILEKNLTRSREDAE